MVRVLPWKEARHACSAAAVHPPRAVREASTARHVAKQLRRQARSSWRRESWACLALTSPPPQRRDASQSAYVTRERDKQSSRGRHRVAAPSLHRMLTRRAARLTARLCDALLPPSSAAPSASCRGYHKNVIDHYEQPRNVGSFDKADPNVGTGLVGAPACGDVMKLQIKVRRPRPWAPRRPRPVAWRAGGVAPVSCGTPGVCRAVTHRVAPHRARRASQARLTRTATCPCTACLRLARWTSRGT